MLAISVNGSIHLQSDSLDISSLSQAECGTLHPVGIGAIERVLIDVANRDIELVNIITTCQSHSVLGLWSPILEHELTPVSVTIVERITAVTHFLDGIIRIDRICLPIQEVIVGSDVSPCSSVIRMHLLRPDAWL